MKSLCIVTNIDANHGTCIFNYSLAQITKNYFPGFENSFLYVFTPSWYLYEILRAYKPNLEIPFYNYKRYRLLMQWSRKNLRVIPFFSIWHHSYNLLLCKLVKRNDEVILVSKVVWDIAQIWQTPKFPNIFWLSEKVKSVKIAYAVSAHRTNMELFRRHKDQVKRLLESFTMIGVRDNITYNILLEAEVNQSVVINKVLDPAFFFLDPAVDTSCLLEKYGIDTNRPILGLLLYGKKNLSQAVYELYHKRGYQVINFNMYNKYVDVNIGHLINPFEWAALFKELDFCITDRFHCSIFCIRNHLPFMAVEPFKFRSQENSKVYDLLADFDLEACYRNPYDPNFNVQEFLDTCLEIESIWIADYKNHVTTCLKQKMENSQAFLKQMHNFFESAF